MPIAAVGLRAVKRRAEHGGQNAQTITCPYQTGLGHLSVHQPPDRYIREQN